MSTREKNQRIRDQRTHDQRMRDQRRSVRDALDVIPHANGCHKDCFVPDCGCASDCTCGKEVPRYPQWSERPMTWLVDEIERLVEGIRALHPPIEGGLGYGPDGYGEISPACPTCGTHEEYAQAWPCSTAALVDMFDDQEDATS